MFVVNSGATSYNSVHNGLHLSINFSRNQCRFGCGNHHMVLVWIRKCAYLANHSIQQLKPAVIYRAPVYSQFSRPYPTEFAAFSWFQSAGKRSKGKLNMCWFLAWKHLVWKEITTVVNSINNKLKLILQHFMYTPMIYYLYVIIDIDIIRILTFRLQYNNNLYILVLKMWPVLKMGI